MKKLKKNNSIFNVEGIVNVMDVNEIIKVLNFELKHTHISLYDLTEIYFYKKYKLLIRYNIEDGDDEKTYSLICNKDNIDMSTLDIYSTRVYNQKIIFSNKISKSASEIMYYEFLYDLRKAKIHKLSNNNLKDIDIDK